MMKFAIYPMFQGEKLVMLREILDKIPDNTLSWYLLWFEGIGVAPDGMDMVDFERKIAHSPRGIEFGWPELKSFSCHVEQTINCLIVGGKNETFDKVALISENNYDSFEYVIEAFDSTEWKIGINSIS